MAGVEGVKATIEMDAMTGVKDTENGIREGSRGAGNIGVKSPTPPIPRVPIRSQGGFMISEILVPSDGSKTAQKAAAYAVDLAKQLKASIIALSVIDKRSFTTAHAVPASETARHLTEPVDDYLREAAEGYAGEVKKLCDQSGVAVKISIKIGHPVEEIVNEAKKSKAHLIVMGSRGRSAISATVLGSVSYGVIHSDKSVPILIVRD